MDIELAMNEPHQHAGNQLVAPQFAANAALTPVPDHSMARPKSPRMAAPQTGQLHTFEAAQRCIMLWQHCCFSVQNDMLHTLGAPMKNFMTFIFHVITGRFRDAFKILRHLNLGTQLTFLGLGAASYAIHQYPTQLWLYAERAGYSPRWRQSRTSTCCRCRSPGNRSWHV